MRLTLSVSNSRSASIKGPKGRLRLSLRDAWLRDFLMLLEGETGETPIRELCRRYGYRSPATYYRKRQLLANGGLSGLILHKRGPRGKFRLKDDVVKQIVAMRFQSPEKNSSDIADALKKSGHSVSSRSVERVLSEFGISLSRRSQNGRRELP
jgi:transposase